MPRSRSVAQKVDSSNQRRFLWLAKQAISPATLLSHCTLVNVLKTLQDARDSQEAT
jgi:hypothetical protein